MRLCKPAEINYVSRVVHLIKSHFRAAMTELDTQHIVNDCNSNYELLRTLLKFLMLV